MSVKKVNEHEKEQKIKICLYILAYIQWLRYD